MRLEMWGVRCELVSWRKSAKHKFFLSFYSSLRDLIKDKPKRYFPTQLETVTQLCWIRKSSTSEAWSTSLSLLIACNKSQKKRSGRLCYHVSFWFSNSQSIFVNFFILIFHLVSCQCSSRWLYSFMLFSLFYSCLLLFFHLGASSLLCHSPWCQSFV